MSTYYYLVCKDDNEYCPACTSVGGGGYLGDSQDLLSPFIYKHRCCLNIKIMSEHELDKETKYLYDENEE